MIELPTIESKIKDLETSYNSFKVGQPFFNGQLDVYVYESDLFAVTFGEFQFTFIPDEGEATVEPILTLYDDTGAIFGYSDSIKTWANVSSVFVEHPPYITTGTIMGKITLKASCAGTLL